MLRHPLGVHGTFRGTGMIPEEILCSILRLDEEEWADYVPADHVTRQFWQLVSDRLVELINNHVDGMELQLSEPEISIHYHRRLRFLAELIRNKLD
jgi:hypothetical protein